MGLFDGTSLQRPVTCEVCGKARSECGCPRDAAGNVLLPDQQTAVVRLEKRGGGKLVTVVEGIDPAASDLPALAKKLREWCAAGGTARESTIEIQGDHRQKAGAALKELGYRVKVR